MSTNLKRRNPDERWSMVANESTVSPFPVPTHPATVSDNPRRPFKEVVTAGLVKVGAMANSPTQRPFWNPAFVTALGFIFVLLTALVTITISWTQTKGDVGRLTDDLKETRQDIRDLKGELRDQKDYTRDAIDQMAREMQIPAPRPPKRREERTQ